MKVKSQEKLTSTSCVIEVSGSGNTYMTSWWYGYSVLFVSLLLLRTIPTFLNRVTVRHLWMSACVCSLAVMLALSPSLPHSDDGTCGWCLCNTITVLSASQVQCTLSFVHLDFIFQKTSIRYLHIILKTQSQCSPIEWARLVHGLLPRLFVLAGAKIVKRKKQINKNNMILFNTKNLFWIIYRNSFTIVSIPFQYQLHYLCLLQLTVENGNVNVLHWATL